MEPVQNLTVLQDITLFHHKKKKPRLAILKAYKLKECSKLLKILILLSNPFLKIMSATLTAANA